MHPTFLFITAHDMRSRRKASAHFICEELQKAGKTRVFSAGFSALSKLRRRDPRLGLESQSNKISNHNGMDCFLWWVPLHPGNSGNRLLQKLSPTLFKIYRDGAPNVLKKWAEEADTIFVESGIGVLFIQKLRKWNPKSQIFYIASDDLSTVEADPFLIDCLKESLPLVDRIYAPSPKLRFPGDVPTSVIPHGMDLNALESDQTQSPYPKGIHAVSVGSMLFDPDFFHLATEARPDITFHAIGCGIDPGLLPKSTIYYKEKPYAETLPYLRHAAFGIAPYRSGKTPYYLCDTSMKLRQYAFLGLPAVCPEFAVGNHNSSRFGYVVGDKSSIAEAIQKALIAPRTRSEDFLSWSEVVAQMTSTNEVAAT